MSAIELKSTVILQDSGGDFTTIGISDALTLHSMSEILDFIYCSASTDFWQNPKAETTGIYSAVSRSPYVFMENDNYIEMEPGDEAYNIGLYGKTVWLYGDSLGTFVNPATTNACVVTNMDVKKFVMHIRNPNNPSGSFRTYWGNDWQTRQASSWTDVGKAFDLVCDIYYQDNGVENFDPENMDTHTHLTNEKIKPYIILPTLNGAYYFASICDEYHHGGSSGYLFNNSGQLFDVLKDSNNNKFSFSPNGIPIPDYVRYYSHGMDYFGVYANELPYSIDFNSGQAWNAYSPIRLKCVPNTLDSMNRIKMMGGIWFFTDKLYKPIIVDGYVTGYGDPTADSDYDNYSYNKGNQHNVPPAPPGPTPPPSSGDDMEAMATGATGSSGGFTHFYVMSPQDLINLLADFYDRASSGETISNNLVCSYILGIPSSEFCATEEVPVAIHNSAQGTPFVSQANYSHIIATNNLLVVGSFDVPRITNTFYDFAPYSTYEVFIPCCGWVALPDTVAGRRINVDMYIDIASCCLKAAVKTNDLGVCAVTNGVLGAAIPMAVIESGILRGNNIQAGLGIIGGGINTGVGAGSGNAMGIGFGVQQILSGLVDCTIAGNTNYTQQKGGTGDITQFAMGHKCYMKVTHPDIDPVVNNSIFGHSVGYLCNSIGELSNFKGFTVCGNPHVTFSASAEEREEIERLLSMGVIL